MSQPRPLFWPGDGWLSCLAAKITPDRIRRILILRPKRQQCHRRREFLLTPAGILAKLSGYISEQVIELLADTPRIKWPFGCQLLALLPGRQVLAQQRPLYRGCIDHTALSVLQRFIYLGKQTSSIISHM